MLSEALAFLWPSEGGYSNRKNDSGGATNFGVTQKEYNAYRSRHGLQTESVVSITKDEATAIYTEDYWNPACCGAMPRKIGIALMDWSVNHGVHGAVQMLQKCAGISLADCDGVAGKQTVQAVNNANEATLLESYLQARLDWYIADGINRPKDQEFERGWQNRVANLRTYLNGLV